jgi:hypothetical protein
MIGVCVFRESRSLGLLGSEKTLLRLGDLIQTLGSFSMRLSHNTILQLM